MPPGWKRTKREETDGSSLLDAFMLCDGTHRHLQLVVVGHGGGVRAGGGGDLVGVRLEGDPEGPGLAWNGWG